MTKPPINYACADYKRLLGHTFSSLAEVRDEVRVPVLPGATLHGSRRLEEAKTAEGYNGGKHIASTKAYLHNLLSISVFARGML